MGEGSAMLLLERYDDAAARGARIYGEIAGFGLTNDGFHMTSPQPEGAYNAAAMQRALTEAALSADDVDLVSAHGSGTRLGDPSEALALQRVFGTRTPHVPVMATKGQHGHALGATGAWETALSFLAMTHGVIPRSVNCDSLDPACEVAVTKARIDSAPRVVLKTSAGFGGINAALVLRSR
jgi:3-oxoacyl-[acyl-carrier-protein] synthase II